MFSTESTINLNEEICFYLCHIRLYYFIVFLCLVRWLFVILFSKFDYALVVYSKLLFFIVLHR